MKKVFPAVFSIFIVVSVFAQDSLIVDDGTKFKTSDSAQLNPHLYNYTSSSLNNFFNEDFRSDAQFRGTIDFDYYGNSNSVSQSIAYAMFLKTRITQKMIDATDKRIKNTMKFEDNMNIGYSFRVYLKKWDGIFTFGLHHREMRNISGPKDAFELIFYGNARFENDTADLSNINFNNFIYNQYSVGIAKKIDYGNYQMQFGFSGAFLQVINHQQIFTKTSSLYTAPDGEYIDINYDLTFNNAREGATKFGQLNGLGGAGAVNLGFMNKDKWKVTLDISDVGYLMFRKNPVNYSAAKNIHFQGIVIPDLLNFSSQTFDTLNLDSAVRSYLPTKSTNQYSVFLPFTAQLVFSKPLLKNKLVLNAGLMYRYLPGYKVYGYVKANYFIQPTMVFSGSIGAGGYSICNVGVEFSKVWRHFDLTVGTSNLPGLIAPNALPGTSLYLRLASSF